MTSRYIDLEGVTNARDLGGIVTMDGKTIRSGVLIRSAQLCSASASDIENLRGYHIDTIIDFRGSRERISNPDVYVGERLNLHLPVLRERNAAIERVDDTRTEKREKQQEQQEQFFLVEPYLKDPDACWDSLCRSYRDFVEDEYSVSVYRQFVKAILAAKNGAVLWHCAGGKDRTGFGSMVIEAILGVSKEEMLNDYLLTNLYNQKDIEIMCEKAKNAWLPDGVSLEDFVKTVLHFCEASEQYFNSAYQAIEELYGDFDGFIRNGLKITEEEKETLKKRYLQ